MPLLGDGAYPLFIDIDVGGCAAVGIVESPGIMVGIRLSRGPLDEDVIVVDVVGGN